MALKKKITFENGITCEYHRISSITLATDAEKKVLQAVVESYVSQPFRAIGQQNAVHFDSFNAMLTTEQVESKPIFELIYDALKETEQFTGAEDC